MSIPMTIRIPVRDRNGAIVDQREYTTYAGLLAQAHEEGLESIETTLMPPRAQVPLDLLPRPVVRSACEALICLIPRERDVPPVPGAVRVVVALIEHVGL